MNPRVLIALEKSANSALRTAADRGLVKLFEDVKAARTENPGRALDLIAKYDMAPDIARVIPVLEELAMSTAIFGASFSKGDPRHTMYAQGRNCERVFKAAHQMAKMTATLGTNTIRRNGLKALTAKTSDERRHVIKSAFQTFCCPQHMLKAEVLKADLVKDTTTIPADQDDISDALNAATLGGGRLAADVGANLTTTRLAAYGYLSQAQEDGKSSYQISAILDEKTCPVCAYMDGKTLDVGRALSQTEDALDADDPADLADIAPWPGQSKDDMTDFLQMDSDDLQEAGYQVPPFHVSCRCVLVDTGTVDDTLRPMTEDEAEDTTSGTNWFSSLLGLLTGDKSTFDDKPKSFWMDE